VKLALAALLLLTAPALAGDIVGRASVIDGDTISIHGTRIRLDGVDAPESWQTCHDAGGKLYRCGARAAEALDELLAASRPTRCRQMDTDRYGRVVAICWTNAGVEVNAAMVLAGQALDWPKYSRNRYQPQQAEAKRHKRGIWSGTFILPWEARRMKRGS
jgi:succinoglycan biosynthesis protein ExoI